MAFAAAAPVIGAVVSGLLSNRGQSSANAANGAIAERTNQEQMAFQERMSSTAHQREVSDLKAAGLNPILSANAGASAPAGAGNVATMQNVDAGFSGLGAAGGSAVQNLLAKRMNDAQVEQVNQATVESRARTDAQRAQEANTRLDTEVKQFGLNNVLPLDMSRRLLDNQFQAISNSAASAALNKANAEGTIFRGVNEAFGSDVVKDAWKGAKFAGESARTFIDWLGDKIHGATSAQGISDFVNRNRAAVGLQPKGRGASGSF